MGTDFNTNAASGKKSLLGHLRQALDCAVKLQYDASEQVLLKAIRKVRYPQGFPGDALRIAFYAEELSNASSDNIISHAAVHEAFLGHMEKARALASDMNLLHVAVLIGYATDIRTGLQEAVVQSINALPHLSADIDSLQDALREPAAAARAARLALLPAEPEMQDEDYDTDDRPVPDFDSGIQLKADQPVVSHMPGMKAR